jgi:hypothetical protein
MAGNRKAWGKREEKNKKGDAGEKQIITDGGIECWLEEE